MSRLLSNLGKKKAPLPRGPSPMAPAGGLSPMAPSPRELSRRHAAVTEGVNSTSSRRGASRCARQSLPRARGRWREAPDEVPGPVVGAGVPDGPFERICDSGRTAYTDVGLLEA